MNIKNKNILWCLKSDSALYWVHTLTQKKTFVDETDTHEIYYSDEYNLYFFYYKEDDYDENHIICDITKLKDDLNNHVHVLVCDFRSISKFLPLIDKINNINYSIINHVGEMVYENRPLKINELKNLKYYFSCSDLFDENNSICNFQKTNKFIQDYKYSLTYFYFKLGFNFIQKGNHIINQSEREDKVFLYTKANKNSQRQELIDMVLPTNRIKSKEFSEDDVFWFKINNSKHHTSFVIDYNTCKFNLVMETQPLQKNQNILSNFCSEKTLKSLMVPTPSYVTLQEDVYYDLKNYGFYFLNEEFGEYDFNNYKMFCSFLSNSSSVEFENLFIKSYEYSKLNKIKLEKYIYSDKIEEIKLLTNKH